MLQTYQGVVENGMVILPKQAKLENGTRVLILPQIETPQEWLTVKRAAKRLDVSAAQVRKWVKSAKVRVHLHDPNLVNADDLEDAIEQDELFDLTMQVVERDEK
jgi:transposase-like protein